MNRKIRKMQKKLKPHLDKDRYSHTLGVMYTAAALAMCHGADLDQALTAGLLHDCAKCIPGETKIRLCRRYHLNISEAEQKNPSLLHAKLGAFLAAKKYHVRDRDILNAIASHTTGRPHMSVLEKIIYIADYMEPGREELPNMGDVRKLAFQDLEECLYRILKDSLTYLNSKDMVIDPMTEKTYLYYKKKLGKEE
ncbi:MAG TPA: bis(5'-nucleosyl)-tetraphosphatase (symmetrical) YqeK [Candidatus Dorea gallistercoris]|uniref:bis(5'-nucleosyl)-tetraphosphatase (symmetrical) n=1 Tax=Candidatus Dorea gallistercoris TaxID=2838542 RepID=A0A9D1R8K7_9FIRM|nr:bis(5'-nucleosyl)-tetraphosphatase (symmetrical) YqeK [Candidatus Dorea gallistercoris]